MRYAASILLLVVAVLAAAVASTAQEQPNPQQVASAQYYYLDAANTRFGPYDLDAVGEAVQGGAITAITLMWTTGMADWAAASTIAAIAPLFAAPDPGAQDAGYWLLDAGGQALGPFTLADIQGKVGTGEVRPWSMVWISTTESWDRADGYTALAPGL